MIEILLMIALIPYVAFRSWLERFTLVPPREGEISKAAHGVALAILVPLVIHWADRNRWYGYLPSDFWPYLQYRWFAAYAVIAFGASWFILGYARSHGYRDMRYIMRSLMKLAVGAGIIYAQIHHLGVDLPLRSETFAFVTIVGYWCIITGLVKVGLYMRGPPRMDYGSDVGQQPYGSAGYGTGFDD